ncbi:hypothetical protein GCM10022247_35520 [Allokutzneria multivorans]|uniref:Uncharacterized protein n=1 Tax=Allokutzneria multivorans TaxID=1142134 RepID=A0ABP7SDE7_9PSEU
MPTNVITFAPVPRCSPEQGPAFEGSGAVPAACGPLLARFRHAVETGRNSDALDVAEQLGWLWVESCSAWAWLENTVLDVAYGEGCLRGVAKCLIRQGWWAAQVGEVSAAMRAWRSARSIGRDITEPGVVAAAELGMFTPNAPVERRAGGIVIRAEVAAAIGVEAQRRGGWW